MFVTKNRLYQTDGGITKAPTNLKGQCTFNASDSTGDNGCPIEEYAFTIKDENGTVVVPRVTQTNPIFNFDFYVSNGTLEAGKDYELCLDVKDCQGWNYDDPDPKPSFICPISVPASPPVARVETTDPDLSTGVSNITFEFSKSDGTPATPGEPVTIEVKDDTGTVLEIITGVKGGTVSSFTSDSAGVTILNWMPPSDIIGNGTTVQFDKNGYETAAGLAGANATSLMFCVTVECDGVVSTNSDNNDEICKVAKGIFDQNNLAENATDNLDSDSFVNFNLLMDANGTNGSLISTTNPVLPAPTTGTATALTIESWLFVAQTPCPYVQHRVKTDEVFVTEVWVNGSNIMTTPSKLSTTPSGNININNIVDAINNSGVYNAVLNVKTEIFTDCKGRIVAYGSLEQCGGDVIQRIKIERPAGTYTAANTAPFIGVPGSWIGKDYSYQEATYDLIELSY